MLMLPVGCVRCTAFLEQGKFFGLTGRLIVRYVLSSRGGVWRAWKYSINEFIAKYGNKLNYYSFSAIYGVKCAKMLRCLTVKLLANFVKLSAKRRV